MALSRVISEIKRDTDRKSRFFMPPCIRRPAKGGGHRRSIAIPFGIDKQQWRGYPMVKMSADMLTVLTQYRRVSDRRTDNLASPSNFHKRRAMALG